MLLFSAERDANAGLYLYDLADPRAPVLLDSALVDGRASTRPPSARSPAAAMSSPPGTRRIPALLIYDVTDPPTSPGGHRADPADYGIHDTYVRDGLAFVFAWNTGVIIYDVGNGIRGRLARLTRSK